MTTEEFAEIAALVATLREAHQALMAEIDEAKERLAARRLAFDGAREAAHGKGVVGRGPYEHCADMARAIEALKFDLDLVLRVQL